MGVPAFFRWLSKKYPSIVVPCTEEKARSFEANGRMTKIPVDTSLPNPNLIEFDNLYLDMNGIIHPCCHPEGKPAPKNEDEMMVLIFEYIDRLFSIVRPRRLLYMAIDGVAPRAKMNQQRSRRFRASKETSELREEISNVKDALRAKGMIVPPDKPAGEHFDSNCITPGTEFMYRLAECLRSYINHRLNTDPGWANVMVILSDANVPGEGEHKIMDYIRRQRAHPDHDPNTHHCLCGADADLIMLGLATHEVNFTILREEFKPNQDPTCQVCGQTGHVFKDCTGLDNEEQGPGYEQKKAIEIEQQFIFLRLNVLREYLYHDLNMANLPFTQDLERAIDDWVLMCFFVGNDFLPHLPSLEIREGAIDKLIAIYKKVVYKTGGYLTDSGIVNLARVQLILTDLGELEDQIFKNRRETDLTFKRRDAEKKKRQQQMSNSNGPRWVTGRQYTPTAPGGSSSSQVGPGGNPRQTARKANGGANACQDALATLNVLMNELKAKKPVEDEVEPEDNVKLWEAGWKGRYYENKFGIGAENRQFRTKVANEYVKGICWVLKYYYQGCASWNWYFPHHYAPFASDFVDIGDLDVEFETNSCPFRPLEQLMSVFPAASKQFLPPTWQLYMDHPESPIIDFYPKNFHVDLNGKKFAWQGVALLPFVDEGRLLKALQEVYPDLTKDESRRNVRGSDKLFVSCRYKGYGFLAAVNKHGSSTQRVGLNPCLTSGIRGKVWRDDFVIRTSEVVKSLVPQLKDYPNNRAICVQYEDPVYEPGYVFPARMIKGATVPPPTLKPDDFDRRTSGQSHRHKPPPVMVSGSSGRSGGGGGYRGRGGYGELASAHHSGGGSCRGYNRGGGYMSGHQNIINNESRRELTAQEAGYGLITPDHPAYHVPYNPPQTVVESYRTLQQTQQQPTTNSNREASGRGGYQRPTPYPRQNRRRYRMKRH